MARTLADRVARTALLNARSGRRKRSPGMRLPPQSADSLGGDVGSVSTAICCASAGNGENAMPATRARVPQTSARNVIDRNVIDYAPFLPLGGSLGEAECAGKACRCVRAAEII